MQPWPLVGREAELRFLEQALAELDVRGVAVFGGAGVGKTRLATEVVDAHRAAGHDALWVIATQAAATLPFAAFARVVAASGRAPDAHELIRQAIDEFDQRAQRGRLILAVDDAQWLDDHSVALVHALATQSRVTLLITVRSDEDVPPTLSGLWKDGLLARLDIHPLTRRHVDRLVRAVLGDDLAPRTLDRLWNLSRGNALFLRELVTSALETRSAGGETPSLSIDGGDDPQPRLRELVEARLGRLSASERDALETIAVGEPLPVELAAELADRDAVAGLERRGLVGTEASTLGDQLRLAHPLYGEVVRAATPGVRRHAILADLTEALAESPRPADLLRVASWRLDAGHEGAGIFYLQAASEALLWFDPELAERLARAALAEGIEAARAVLVQALTAQRRVAEAERALAVLDLDGPEGRAQEALARAFNLFWGQRDVPGSLHELAGVEVLDAVVPDLALQARSLRAQYLQFAGYFEDALAAAEVVLDDPRATGATRFRSLLAAYLARAAAGEGRGARGLVDEAAELARRHADEIPAGNIILGSTHVLALIFSGRPAKAQEVGEQVAQAFVAGLPDPFAAVVAAARGLPLAARGHAREAYELMGGAMAVGPEGDWFGFRPGYAAHHARAAVWCGDVGAAQATLTLVDGEPSTGNVGFHTDLELSRAWVEAALGDVNAAVERALATLGHPHSFPAAAAEALHFAVRFGGAGSVANKLAALATATDAPLIAAYTAHAQGLVEGNPDLVDDAAQRMEDLGADLVAAEVFRDAARLYVGSGRRAEALAAERRCQAALDRCGRPVSPALSPEPFSDEDQLTPREREVALLAAQGLSSSDIAEQLGTSVRTVDTHLGRVYRKLEISGRADLATAFGLG